MATITSSTVAIPAFTGLKSSPTRLTTVKLAAPTTTTTTTTPKLSIKSSLKTVTAAVIATAAAGILAGNAMAVEVLLGASDGGLVFVPKEFTIAAGEEIVFKNNAGFPHNIVFEEDDCPSGVDVSKISMDEQDLLNAPGEEYKVKLTEKGTYSFYCAPHQGSGMVGKVTVT